MGRVLAANKEERLAVCRACPFFAKGYKCTKCGCNMNMKCAIKRCKCPISKWGPGLEIE